MSCWSQPLPDVPLLLPGVSVVLEGKARRDPQNLHFQTRKWGSEGETQQRLDGCSQLSPQAYRARVTSFSGWGPEGGMGTWRFLPSVPGVFPSPGRPLGWLPSRSCGQLAEEECPVGSWLCLRLPNSPLKGGEKGAASSSTVAAEIAVVVGAREKLSAVPKPISVLLAASHHLLPLRLDHPLHSRKLVCHRGVRRQELFLFVCLFFAPLPPPRQSRWRSGLWMDGR